MSLPFCAARSLPGFSREEGQSELLGTDSQKGPAAEVSVIQSINQSGYFPTSHPYSPEDD